MKLKHFLFTGIFLLTLGVLLKAIYKLQNLGLTLILIGVSCKFIYVILKIKRGEYKPGIEIISLVLGLLLFLTGLYLVEPDNVYLRPIYFIISGIALKIFFIVRFIQIIRSNRRVK